MCFIITFIKNKNIREESDIWHLSYIIHNNFINNQYLSLKLDNYNNTIKILLN